VFLLRTEPNRIPESVSHLDVAVGDVVDDAGACVSRVCLDVESLEGLVEGHVIEEDVSNAVHGWVWRHRTDGHSHPEVHPKVPNKLVTTTMR